MPYDQAVAQSVRQAMTGRGMVEEKPMMGGLVFMLDGNMCCGVSGSSLMVRVGAGSYQSALANAHVRPLVFGGRRPRGFVLIDAAGYQSQDVLAQWLQCAITFVSELPPKSTVTKLGSRPRR